MLSLLFSLSLCQVHLVEIRIPGALTSAALVYMYFGRNTGFKKLLVFLALQSAVCESPRYLFPVQQHFWRHFEFNVSCNIHFEPKWKRKSVDLLQPFKLSIYLWQFIALNTIILAFFNCNNATLQLVDSLTSFSPKIVLQTDFFYNATRTALTSHCFYCCLNSIS